jgi:hypothetical protein
MTTVLAASCPAFAVVVSDRLVTLARPTGEYLGQHDSLANKSVVLITSDAVLAIGFAGTAYLDGIPSDQWLAQVLWGAPLAPKGRRELPTAIGGRRPGRRGIANILFDVRARLARVRGGRDISFLAVGWRFRRRRLVPVAIEIRALGVRGERDHLSMRPPRALELRQHMIGIAPSEETFLSAYRDAPPQPKTKLEVAGWLADTYASVIRGAAAVDKRVGPHVMQVILPEPFRRRIVCKFDPQKSHFGRLGELATVPIAFTPWVITDYGFQSACAVSGLSFKRIVNGWSIEFAGPPPRDEEYGFVAPQPRRPRP